jgi:plasmid stability protein
MAQENRAVGTLTIRNLEDPLKRRLRLRAAARNRSMEEEARQILRAALQEPAVPTPDLGARIRARFAGLGDVQLPIEAREPVRASPALIEPLARPVPKRRPGAAVKRRR